MTPTPLDQVQHEHDDKQDKLSVASVEVEVDTGAVPARNSYYRPSPKLMLTIPETEETAHSSAVDHASSSVQATPVSPSLLHKLTNRMRSPMTQASPAAAAAAFSSIRSFRRNRDYTHLQDEDAHAGDADVDRVSVDISTLGGMGFEMTTVQPHWLHQPTAYVSPRFDVDLDGDAHEESQRLTQHHVLGNGLDTQVQLTRNATTRAAESHRLSRSEMIQRSKTLRHIGQNMAEERRQIVAVSEAVDLGFMEGSALNRSRTDQSFDDMLLSSATTNNNNPQSYFFPKDPKIPNWRPVSMRKLYILLLAALAFTLAGVQEYLCQLSIRKEKVNSGILSFDRVVNISVWHFFVWKYLPTMITIVYAVLFSIMDFDIRRLEPYYQLSQPQGSAASASLNLDHLTMFQYFIPFKALRLRQWAVFFSTIGNIIASTAAPALQNPSVNFVQNRHPSCDRKLGRCANGEMLFFVRIDHVWSRLLTVSYLIIGSITLILMVQLRRKSGLLSDPQGIAGIAAMATKSHILHDFKGIDLATRGEIHKRLAHRRYVLYQSSIWQGQWSPYKEAEQESDSRLKTPHPPMLRLSAGIPFVGILVTCLIFVPLISLTSLNTIANAAPWLPILVATMLKLVWTTFEADVRLMEPFYQLSLGHAKPENSLTLDYQATVYGYMPFKAVFNGHYLVAAVGICSIALDILSVTVGSFSVNAEIFLAHMQGDGDISNGSETSVSFWTSVVLSMIILTFVICITICVYVRRRHPFLPREPSTIAAVLAFIYASNMLDDFIGTETLTHKQMEARLKARGKRYGLGWFKGRDGLVHCAIDEEPMRSHYVHGKPYHLAIGTVPPHETYTYV